MIRFFLTAGLLFGPNTPEPERHKKLAPLFKPEPGQALVLDRLSLLENSSRPGYIKGYIELRPPKGQCLILRRDIKKRDQRICKPTPISWELEDLATLGAIKFQVLLDAEWDDGTTLTWQTAYRIGSFVEAGMQDSGDHQDIVIKSCQAFQNDSERSIALESFGGRRWKITLPEVDTPVRDVDPPIPNLLVNVDKKKNPDGTPVDEKAEAAKRMADEKASDEPQAGEKAPSNKPPSGGGSALGRLLTTGYKEDKIKDVTFNLPMRGAYRMESGRFSETGSPKGMNGVCRYMFKNAPGDPESGAIECHNTDTLDNVYVHVPCFAELTVRPASSRRSQSQGKEGAKE